MVKIGFSMIWYSLPEPLLVQRNPLVPTPQPRILIGWKRRRASTATARRNENSIAAADADVQVSLYIFFLLNSSESGPLDESKKIGVFADIARNIPRSPFSVDPVNSVRE